jgi:hypothetical protein
MPRTIGGRLLGTLRSLFHDSPLLNDGMFGPSTGHGGGPGGSGPGGGPGGSTAGEPIGLLLALTKAA